MSSRTVFASVVTIVFCATSLAAWNNGTGVTGLYRGYEKETFYSPAAGTTVGFTIYTPPEYDPGDSKRYPVVYYLHGSGGDELNYGGWFEHDLYDSINLMSLVETGRFPPTIVVMPNGSMGSYTYGSTEAMIINDLLPYVDANWKTLAMRGARACEGFSKGGYGNSVWIGTHRDLFSSIIPIAGFSTAGINSGNAADIIATVRIRLVKGNLDADRDMTAFKAHLNSLGIPYDEQNIPEAGHDVFAVYQAAGIANMQWNYDTFRYFLDGPDVDAGTDQAIQLPD